MDYSDVLAFVKTNPVLTIATIDNDQPRVRGFLSVFFDKDDRIYFTTAAMKSVYKQLAKNQKAELCYLAPDFKTMLRITSTLEFVDDRAKKKEIIELQSYLKGASADDPNFILIRVTHGRARFWNLMNNLKESELEVVEF